MRNLRIVALLSAIASMSAQCQETERSARELDGALINIKQPQKKTVVKFKSKNKHSTKFKSTKPIKSKAVNVYRNKSNI